ncbi:MAG: TolC family protein [Pirellulales bacterium]
MMRQLPSFTAILALTVLIATGCHPTQPYYLFDDGDLSHYLDVAMEIETPDVEAHTLDEVLASQPPLTLDNMDDVQMWDVTLEEVTHHTLANSEMMRKLGGRIAGTAPDEISRTIINPFARTTVYDPALAETAYGANTGAQVANPLGVEAALSEFDARLDSSIFWEKNDRPQNFAGFPDLFTPTFEQDLGRFTAGITKQTAAGTQVSVRNNTIYDANNNPTRALYSDWNTNFEATVSQPLLQGAGTMYNRIAGPYSFNQYSGGFFNSIDGVVIARVRTDQALADFEGGLRDLVRNTEDAYWDLYFAYRDLDARITGRDSALAAWRRVNALYIEGAEGGAADQVAQAESQFWDFHAQVQTALTELQRAENRLRYIMGLPIADGQLIRPSDEPTMAWVEFDWNQILEESLVRRVEIRKEKWQVKERELQLIAAKNHLLPRLDAVARMRWLGMGDDLLDNERSGISPVAPGSNAFESLTGGDFQEWQLGLQLNVPIGFRLEHSAIRHHQLLLEQERRVLQELEHEIQHQVGNALRDLKYLYELSLTQLKAYNASKKEVAAREAAYEVGTITLDLLLDSQRRLAIAESNLYRSLTDYNRAIMTLHYRKGSLLDFNSVYLAEGPWPGKAYFDAHRRARKRDAAMYIDYGYTRPGVVSRGPYHQQQGDVVHEGELYLPTEAMPEEVPTPAPRLPEAEELPQPEPISTGQAATGPAAATPAVRAVESNRGNGPLRAGHVEHVSHQEVRTGEAADSSAKRPPRSRVAATTNRNAGESRFSDKYRKSTGANTVDRSDEPVANHSASTTAAPASGWQGTQRHVSSPGLRR